MNRNRNNPKMRSDKPCTDPLLRVSNTGDNVQAWAADHPKTITLLTLRCVPCVRSGASG